ncbi:cytochrome c oxidase subunit II [Dinghuibacter silviterrae]|uniref:Cytochrome c oxidase subunit 2 n=1 Tax=Dinghuibacter silviterrae TaxID=1539049 RepID=A0A4R8DPI5_9BACT|nr:cytochrome c oxidase subunit II [Dinghuibacter silviterrae]TDW99645.1 cytochrome c oxidase subunit 2 [Dinghuibacter silviterrae]
MSFLLIATVILVFVVIFQIAKASEYVSVLKGEDKTREQNNRINAFLMLAFLILGLIGVWWCNDLLYKKTLLPLTSASKEGMDIDRMLWITLAITGVVFIITQILLFSFVYRFQEKPGKKAFFFPHNNKLEVLWTVVPAVFLLVLVVFGLKYWFHITGEAPKDAIEIEITGKQFNWIYRYPGKDGKFGKTYFKNISDAKGNPLGQLWDDPANQDDIVVTDLTMHIPVNHPVKLIIHSRDVIHDVGLSQFRMKMDAVPGIPTTLWFTPQFTTDEMKQKTGNPDFVYEISCDQMCGPGHFGMRGIIQVDSEADYKKWLDSKKANYYSVFPEKAPGAAAPADTTKKIVATIK